MKTIFAITNHLDADGVKGGIASAFSNEMYSPKELCQPTRWSLQS